MEPNYLQVLGHCIHVQATVHVVAMKCMHWMQQFRMDLLQYMHQLMINFLPTLGMAPAIVHAVAIKCTASLEWTCWHAPANDIIPPTLGEAITSRYLWHFRILSGSRHLGGLKYIGFICGIYRNMPYITGKRLYSYSLQYTIQCILEALLVHDCVCQDRHRSCYPHNTK